jgi:hypothetical protein
MRTTTKQQNKHFRSIVQLTSSLICSILQDFELSSSIQHYQKRRSALRNIMELIRFDFRS